MTFSRDLKEEREGAKLLSGGGVLQVEGARVWSRSSLVIFRNRSEARVGYDECGRR